MSGYGMCSRCGNAVERPEWDVLCLSCAGLEHEELREEAPMPDERTPSQIADEHDALRERATPGPWVVVGDWQKGGLGIEHHASDEVDDPRSCAITYSKGSYLPPLPANAAYITALANDDAAMCTAVRTLEAEVARLRKFEPSPDPMKWSFG